MQNSHLAALAPPPFFPIHFLFKITQSVPRTALPHRVVVLLSFLIQLLFKVSCKAIKFLLSLMQNSPLAVVPPTVIAYYSYSNLMQNASLLALPPREVVFTLPPIPF